MTPHNSAKKGDFAKTVLMPGDPLRSEFVAKNYLEAPRLVNNVRGVQGYTGTYKGKPVSVMASGMGMPSMGIYSYELYNFYGVENIIRIGSAGGLSSDVKLRDIVIAASACTDSNYLNSFGLSGSYSPICDFELLKYAVSEAESAGIGYHVGNVLSTDLFYGGEDEKNEKWRDMGVLAVEMETAALYANAAAAGKRALSVCTVSDHIFTGESLEPEERERGFGEMIKLALDISARM